MNRSWRSAGPWRFPTARTIYSIRFGTEWKYLSVRRTALFIEESLYRGMQWAAFEPNEEPMAIRFGSSRNTIAELASSSWAQPSSRRRVDDAGVQAKSPGTSTVRDSLTPGGDQTSMSAAILSG